MSNAPDNKELPYLTESMRELLVEPDIVGKEINAAYIRGVLKINPESSQWDQVRVNMNRFVSENLLKPTGKRAGLYKVIKSAKQVQIFGQHRARLPAFRLVFPRDRDTGEEMSFADSIVVRQGDLILISGLSNFGKSSLCINFAGENIDSGPVLMGNEYTSLDDEPTPRFLNKLDNMDWVQWTNGSGMDKFTLLPVRDDYADHVVRDRINIIDWINIASGEYYLISKIMEEIKLKQGNGVSIIAIQKGEGADAGRGGQMTKDFADVELLIDRFGDGSDVLLKIGKVKESTGPVVGKTFAYSIEQGVKIVNFREIKKCGSCYGRKYTTKGKCFQCRGTGYVEAEGYGDPERGAAAYPTQPPPTEATPKMEF